MKGAQNVAAKVTGDGSKAAPVAGRTLSEGDDSLLKKRLVVLTDGVARYVLDHGLHPRRPITGDDIREHFSRAITTDSGDDGKARRKKRWEWFRDSLKVGFDGFVQSTPYYKKTSPAGDEEKTDPPGGEDRRPPARLENEDISSGLENEDAPSRRPPQERQPPRWLMVLLHDRAYQRLLHHRDHHYRLRAQLEGSTATSAEELVKEFLPKVITAVARDPIAMLDLALRAGEAVQWQKGDIVQWHKSETAFKRDGYRFEPTEDLVRTMPSPAPPAPTIPNLLVERSTEFLRLANEKLGMHIGDEAQIALLGRCLAAMIEGLALARRRKELPDEAESVLIAAATAAVAHLSSTKMS